MPASVVSRLVRPAILAIGLAASLASAMAQEGLIWHGYRYDGRGSASFGIPETDATPLTITCPGRDRSLTIDFRFDLPPDFLADPHVRLEVDGAEFRQVANAIYGAEGAAHFPSLPVHGGDPLVGALMRGQTLTVFPPAKTGAAPYTISLSGSAAVMREFLAPCLPS
ncbi:hypothetical protein [Jiella marina]|uniref:hypothetical protein n=1 Tax=Jiella sp. LLJ827 TaxID=2917712 RepID=UPI002101481D|nr:hypothetical protein [Jiella sp. LLJ827]MCQ0986842.1 hypothetical protein [Jiella sp. LLJ827]